jgi:hypothetical protein
MNDYKYKLERSSRKHLCPNCNKQRFVRYIDTETYNYLPEQYGRCDREADCAYHLNPYTDGYAQRLNEDENKIEGLSNKHIHSIQTRLHTVTFIPVEVLKKTRQGWEHNMFLQNLLNRIPYPFNPSAIENIIVHYQLGTVLKGYMAGAVTFPFIDEMNNIRAIQVKQFDESNHTTTTTFLHSIIEKNLIEANSPIPEWLKQYHENELKVSCLFGAHLLPKYPCNPVALVEAPKSAIIATLYYGLPEKPDRLLWLAVYNLSSLSLEKCRVLKGRTVILFPDLSKEGTAFQLWSEKAKTMEKQLPGIRFIVNNLLEQKASTKAKSKGYDLADYLIQFDHHTFANKNPEQLAIQNKAENEIPIPSVSSYHESLTHIISPIMHKENFFPEDPPDKKRSSPIESWDLDSLKSFFSSTQLPDPPIRLDLCTVIHDLPKFISGHLAVLNTYNGNPVFYTYLQRIHLLQQIIQSSLLVLA